MKTSNVHSIEEKDVAFNRKHPVDLSVVKLASGQASEFGFHFVIV